MHGIENALETREPGMASAMALLAEAVRLTDPRLSSRLGDADAAAEIERRYRFLRADACHAPVLRLRHQAPGPTLVCISSVGRKGSRCGAAIRKLRTPTLRSTTGLWTRPAIRLTSIERHYRFDTSACSQCAQGRESADVLAKNVVPAC